MWAYACSPCSTINNYVTVTIINNGAASGSHATHSIHFLNSLLSPTTPATQKPIPAVSGQDGGHTPDSSSVQCKANTERQTTLNVHRHTSIVNQTCMSLDCGGHGEHANSTQEDPQPASRVQTEALLLWGGSSNALLHPVEHQWLFFLAPSIHHTLMQQYPYAPTQEMTLMETATPTPASYPLQ